MARGWESKSVESQIESAEANAAKPSLELTPEQKAVERERDCLRLSRTRILHDLENAHNPRYQQQLTAALEHIDNQLKKMS